MVSGFHCQEGTSMNISVLYPVHAANINQAKAKMQGKSVKKAKGG
jgi:hypothetical protein